MPTFSSAPTAAAFDKTASQPLGALSTGMGYDPAVATTETTQSKYIGGADQTIGYGKGTQVVDVEREEVKPKAKK